MNQQGNLGVWMPLGSYLVPGDGSVSVVLTDQANGEVVADAVRLTADQSQVRSATWTYSASESGDYRVFARWPEGEGHATDAKYTVSHTAGSSVVTVSQAQRGGQWNELGTFAFAGGQDYAVSLSDDANGIVVADALYIVKVEELADAVTWVPALPASGTYQVYAKWTADETRATDARYSIVHEGGTAEVSVNQRAAGGLWQYLGSYTFDPLNTPTVTLAANDNGSVAADAVRFVGGPGGATDIVYLHSDHLGTPQAMTDVNAQVLWWRDQTPFGQTVAEGGFSVSPLRFPGQYADAESGLAYNYFRDYDPALGRYIQSDPIGLGGGLNTYGYVGGNPLSFADPTGLAKLPASHPHCVDLRRKINNARDAINEKDGEYDADIQTLPERIGPGERLADTRRGHRKTINKLWNSLRKYEKRYADECEDDCDDSGGGGGGGVPFMLPKLKRGMPCVDPFFL